MENISRGITSARTAKPEPSKKSGSGRALPSSTDNPQSLEKELALRARGLIPEPLKPGVWQHAPSLRACSCAERLRGTGVMFQDQGVYRLLTKIKSIEHAVRFGIAICERLQVETVLHELQE